MKVTRITVVVLWALTMLPLAPLAAKAAVDGFGMHSPPATGQWPYGYYDVPQYTPDYDPTYPTPETNVVAPTPPTVGCQHSEQTVKVPSESGEMREVTILRC